MKLIAKKLKGFLTTNCWKWCWRLELTLAWSAQHPSPDCASQQSVDSKRKARSGVKEIPPRMRLGVDWIRPGVEECEMELKCLSGAATRMVGGGFRHNWWRCEGGVDCVRGCQSGEKRGKEEDDRTEESSSMRGDSTRWARLLAHINGGESAVIMDGCDQSTFPWWHVYRLERGGLSTSWPMDSLELFLAVGFVPWSNGPCGVFA